MNKSLKAKLKHLKKEYPVGRKIKSRWPQTGDIIKGVVKEHRVFDGVPSVVLNTGIYFKVK